MGSTRERGSANTYTYFPTKGEHADEIPDLENLSLEQKCEKASASQPQSSMGETSANHDLSSEQSEDLDPTSTVKSESSENDEIDDSASEEDSEYDSNDHTDGFEMEGFEYDSDGDIIFEVDLSEEKKKKVDEAARKEFLKQHLTPIELFIHSLSSVEARYLPESDRACGICAIRFEEGETPDFAVRLPCSHLIGKECLRDMLKPKEEGGLGRTSCYRCRQPMAIPEE